MTAEIAVLNKHAAALAADSAVTTPTQRGEKIYNTANKLFSLSKYHPVGIMVYANAEFMGIPWESIIKIYRNHLDKRKFPKLEDYAEHFLAFLKQESCLFPETRIASFISHIRGYFVYLRDEIDKKVKNVFKTEGEINDDEVAAIANEVITEHYEKIINCEANRHLSKTAAEQILKRYQKIIKDVANQVFEKLPVSPAISKALMDSCIGIIFKDIHKIFITPISGVVIAGFGENEVFPSVASFILEFAVDNQLKYKRDEKRTDKISPDNNALVFSFAQTEMVQTFMEGIDPRYHQWLATYLVNLFNKYPEIIAGKIHWRSAGHKKTFISGLQKMSQALLEDFFKKATEFRKINNVSSILKAVANLPKDELATMAETLVNLTCFKLKVSLESETVGEPIDVAVISKGDGFIWIKRKHYFKPELNHHFFANYFREPQILGGKNE
ncbi:hypothetical protein KAX06_03265 [candidate division WOR-3 bacterium]|nr:hypothetical protein [candidate division WOR-3 bacterium]